MLLSGQRGCGAKQVAWWVRECILNCGAFTAQHIVWTLQLLGAAPWESQSFTWADVKLYTSTRNSLKLYRRMLRDFRPEHVERHPKRCRLGQHEFVHPLKKLQGVRASEAGRFMLDVFQLFCQKVQLCSGVEVTCRILCPEEEDRAASKQASGKLSEEQIGHLCRWANFATNSCMHEKVFNDFFKHVNK